MPTQNWSVGISLEAQIQKLSQCLEPKFLVKPTGQAVASNLNITMGKKPIGSSNGLEYTDKSYFRKPWPPQCIPEMDGSLHLNLTCWDCNGTSHQKKNCVQLNWQLALEQWEGDKKVASNTNTMTAAGGQPGQLVNWTLL